MEDLLSWCLLMFMAGLDTVSIQLAYAFWHLAGHPDDRTRIAGDPSVIPSAVEEFLRYFAFVAPARKVMQDTDFHGCPLKTGDMVFVPLSGATRASRPASRTRPRSASTGRRTTTSRSAPARTGVSARIWPGGELRGRARGVALRDP